MAEPDRVSVLVCRGCCCGTSSKHPDVDHRRQLEALRAASVGTGRARLWEVDCLGPCEMSNVIVVRRGPTRRWFGQMLDPDDTRVLADWIRSGARTRPPPRLAARQFDPDQTAGALVDPVEIPTADLADLISDTLTAKGGSWSIGVHGAVGEFVPDGDTAVTRTGRTVEAVGPTAAVRLTIGEALQAFTVRSDSEPSTVVSVILATRRPTAAAPVRRPAQLTTDLEPIRPDDAGATYFDLGIGHDAATFAVRTTDPELIEILRACVGRPWIETVEHYGPQIVSASPHRVVSSAAGRVEVYGTIPQPGDPSPAGSHTHLLPAELQLGRELPPGVALPPGLLPVATFHPEPGWTSGLIDRR